MPDKFKTGLAEDEILEWFDHLGEEDGSCFAYSEVYGGHVVQEFLFEHMGIRYFVEDQYCTNPECKCDDVILTFYDIIESREEQERVFAVRMSLLTGKYDIEVSNIGKDGVDNIFSCFLAHNQNDMSLMRNRYRKMKEFGRKRILRKRQKQDIKNTTGIKVGRNDPCPCGSGKKYKKCCGI